MKRNVARTLSLKLWSTRISSSRQFVGWAGDEVKKQGLTESPGTQFEAPEPFGAGISASKACAVVWLVVKAGSVEIFAPTFGQSAGPKLQISVKSPPRSALLGTGRLK